MAKTGLVRDYREKKRQHLVVVSERVLEAIIDGKKTAGLWTSRPPYECVFPEDQMYFRLRRRPVEVTAVVSTVFYTRFLDRDVMADYARQLYLPKNFKLPSGRLFTIASFNDVRRIEPINVRDSEHEWQIFDDIREYVK